MIHPDNPQRISTDYLARLDKDPPGTWLAQRKYDGWRRVLAKEKGKWTAYSKHQSAGSTQAMPQNLLDALDALPVYDGTVLDSEWMGNRCSQWVQGHTLHIFDVLAIGNDSGIRRWLRDVPFEKRHVEMLAMLSGCKPPLFLVECVPNPGMLDLFQRQLQEPLSEGIVVRKASSGLILDQNKPATNASWFKIKYREV